MGGKSKRSKTAARASQKRKYFNGGCPKGKFAGILPGSPLQQMKKGDRISKKKLFFDQIHPVEIFRKKPLVVPKSTKVEERVFSVNEENKYFAILDYERELISEKKVANVRTNEIAALHQAGSGRNLRKLAANARLHRSLIRKEGSGRPPTVTNREEIIQFMREWAKERDYEFTLEQLGYAVKNQFGVGSKCSVRRIMVIEDWVKSKKYIKPYLSEQHEADRLAWAEDRDETDFFQEEVVVVHVDEKYFYAIVGGRVCHYPKDCEPPSHACLSKTQISKVMFFGAVAPPNPAREFDGRVGLWKVTEEKSAINNSKYHERGDVYEVPTMMTGAIFVQMCKEKLIPAIAEKLKWAKKVEIQMDSAGGHKVKTSVQELNEYCQSVRAYQKISFVTQPTRSPDLNVLDLGIWNSIQSGVPSVKHEPESKIKIADRIVTEVERAWGNYDGYTKLKKIFNTLNMIYKEVIKANGRNNFKMPHSRNYKK